MSDHFVTVKWAEYGHVDFVFQCKAPTESPCHAVYECDCESWVDQGSQLGQPWHESGEESERHYGVYDPVVCGLRDWFENTDEAMRGETTFPIDATWMGDYYLFNPEVPQ